MADQPTQSRAHPIAPSGDSSNDAAIAGGPSGERRATLPPRRSFFALRREIPRWQAVLFGVLCIIAIGGAWWFVTREDASGERILSSLVLPSPSETFAEFHSLWFDQALTRNTGRQLAARRTGLLAGGGRSECR